MSPGRVPITTPPIGVSPMVVSTDLPSTHAVTLHPLPRCAIAIRRGNANPAAARSCATIDSHDSPWNPYRRTPCARTSAGSGYTVASSGMVSWNTVSKHAKCGTSVNRRIISSITSSASGLCSGAYATVLCSSATTAGVNN